MKKKILSLTLVVCLLAIAVVGGTLAYFTDAEEATNVFTVGDLDITLHENFDPDNAVLQPGTKTQNAINKDVWVTNDGDNSAWVRVKVYVPAKLDVLATPPANYEEVAAKNILHWNIVSGIDEVWNVVDACYAAKLVNVDGNDYNEYVFYYDVPLGEGEATAQLLDQVYLDSKVDCEKDAQGNLVYTLNGEVVDLSNTNIIVKAEAIQAEGFDTHEAAFAAFDAQN